MSQRPPALEHAGRTLGRNSHAAAHVLSLFDADGHDDHLSQETRFLGSDPDPGGCGYGRVGSIPETTVSVEVSCVNEWYKVGG